MQPRTDPLKFRLPRHDPRLPPPLGKKTAMVLPHDPHANDPVVVDIDQHLHEQLLGRLSEIEILGLPTSAVAVHVDVEVRVFLHLFFLRSQYELGSSF